MVLSDFVLIEYCIELSTEAYEDGVYQGEAKVAVKDHLTGRYWTPHHLRHRTLRRQYERKVRPNAPVVKGGCSSFAQLY